jgi:hypothetical protein
MFRQKKDIKTDRHTAGLKERQTDEQRERHISGQREKYTDGQRKRQMKTKKTSLNQKLQTESEIVSERERKSDRDTNDKQKVEQKIIFTSLQAQPTSIQRNGIKMISMLIDKN